MLGESHVIDLLADYLLNALGEEQTFQVAKHLEACDACRVEMLAYQQILSDLPLALATADPPGEMKVRLLRQIETGNQTAPPVDKPSRFQPLVNRIKNSAPTWGLASLALVVILMISNVFLWRQAKQTGQPDQSTMKVIQIEGTENAPEAVGTIVLSTTGEYGTLVVDRLPTLNPNQQYQLWLILDGRRTSGGVFSVSDEGYFSLPILSPLPLNSYQAFGITIEPTGGSPQPTGKKVMGSQG